MDPTVIVGAGIFGSIAAVGGALSWRRARRRSAELEAYAGRIGWSFVERDDSLIDRWPGAPFEAGNGCRARNVLRGSHRGLDATVFDYRYTETTGSGDNRHTETYEFQIWALRMPQPLPRLTVRPAELTDRVAKAFGFGSPDLESEDFNRAYRVEADDPRFGMAVVHPRMMEFLLASTPWIWRLEGDTLISYRREYAPIDELAPRLDLMVGAIEWIPAFVWSDYRP